MSTSDGNINDEKTNDPVLNDFLYASFWVGVIATVVGVFALGRGNEWPTGLTMLLGYGGGAIVGIFVMNCLLAVPTIRRRYQAQPQGMGYGVSYADLIVPYLIAGLLAALVFVPLARKHTRLSTAPAVTSPQESDR